MKKLILLTLLISLTTISCSIQSNPLEEVALQHAIDTLISNPDSTPYKLGLDIQCFELSKKGDPIKSFVAGLVNLYRSGNHVISKKEYLVY